MLICVKGGGLSKSDPFLLGGLWFLPLRAVPRARFYGVGGGARFRQKHSRSRLQRLRTYSTPFLRFTCKVSSLFKHVDESKHCVRRARSAMGVLVFTAHQRMVSAVQCNVCKCHVRQCTLIEHSFCASSFHFYAYEAGFSRHPCPSLRRSQWSFLHSAQGFRLPLK